VTTRFSLAELAEMLHVPVVAVRNAVDELAAGGELTAESFVFGGRNWRIAPSDTKRIQSWLEMRSVTADLPTNPARRKVTRKVVQSPPEGTL